MFPGTLPALLSTQGYEDILKATACTSGFHAPSRLQPSITITACCRWFVNPVTMESASWNLHIGRDTKEPTNNFHAGGLSPDIPAP